jgi:outer membrane protein assembly factor BamD (BamD/ComL family)
LGRKQIRTGKYLYLSIACLIFVSLSGCATLKENEAKRKARESLRMAQEFLDQGDYEGALKENQRVLSLYGNVPPGDEALFNTGLLYAHPHYPKKDYKKSMDLFRRLVKMFPHSPLAGQAKVWIGILQENERLNRDIEGLNKTIRKSKQVDIDIDEKKKEHTK